MRDTNKLLSQLNHFLMQIGVDYAICGGHAIDLFAGRLTRPHKDLDVAAFWDERDKVVAYMLRLGWTVLEPIGTKYFHKIKNNDSQRRIKNNIWCVQPGNPHYQITEHEDDIFEARQGGLEQTALDYIEFLFNHRENGCFLYARNHCIRRAMEKAVLYDGGIPYLAPEIVLLYQSTALDNPSYLHDFDIALPLLSGESKSWLSDALRVMNPSGHIRLDRIEGSI